MSAMHAGRAWVCRLRLWAGSKGRLTACCCIVDEMTTLRSNEELRAARQLLAGEEILHLNLRWRERSLRFSLPPIPLFFSQPILKTIDIHQQAKCGSIQQARAEDDVSSRI